MRTTIAIAAAAVAVAAACSDPAPRPAPAAQGLAPPVAPPAAQPVSTAAAPAPAASPPTIFPAPPAGAITATGGSSGLAAWSTGRSSAFVQPLGEDGAAAGEARELPLTSAHKLHAIYPVGGGFAVAAHDLCPDRKHFFKCLFLRAVSAAGVPVGDETMVKTREWIRAELVARSGGVTGVLTAHMYIPPAFMRLSLDPGGALIVDRRDLPIEEDAVDAVRLTAEAGGFTAILRSQVDESGRPFRIAIDAAGKVKGP